MTKKATTEVELEKAIVRVVIEAEFEVLLTDNGEDVDGAIEEALTALQGPGCARVASRRLFGVPR
ncbi:MAG TPA: hypothetical protein VFN64_04860 [Burkholderiaceae bacterium]|nr:hypothetical protein [Burkholderiaceae bacterium]